MRRNLFGLIWGIVLLPLGAMASMPGDSVGTKVVNGKRYVLLKIVAGDNLSSIARQFNTSIEQIREVNQLPGTNIQLGQVIMVASCFQGPSTQSGANVSAANQTKAHPQTVLDPKKHKVESGESLFAVARKYNVSVEQIKKWNNLSSDALRVGQVLIVSDPQATEKPAPEVVKSSPPADQKAATPEGEKGKPAASTTTSTDTVPAEPGTHVVKPGETLYGIARLYSMDARDLKVLNKLEDPNLKVGQVLKVKMDPPANPNQGKALMDMLSGEQPADSTGTKEAFPDLNVLTASPTTMVAAEAKVTMYRDKASGKNYKQIEEEGTVGPIEDYITDQTKFYAFHRYLPVGSYVRIDFPEKGQSILAEVTSQLPARDPYMIRLSAKCLDYLMVRKPGANVKVKYVIPAAN